MARNRFYIPTSEVASIATQIGYRRKKVSIVVTTSVLLHNLNWDGGTKNVYYGIDLSNGNVSLAGACRVHQMFNEREGARVALIPGVAIAQTGTFRGKPALMSIYVHPDNVPASLESYRGEVA
jgi:hypothetical protein